MTDRAPLEESQEQPQEQEPIEEGPSEGSGGGESIDEFYDMQELSVMLGFEDKMFEGMKREADRVYEWAKSNTTGDPLDAIHELIRSLGIQSKGKDLLRKLSYWTVFDTQQRDLEKRKSRIV